MNLLIMVYSLGGNVSSNKIIMRDINTINYK